MHFYFIQNRIINEYALILTGDVWGQWGQSTTLYLTNLVHETVLLGTFLQLIQACNPVKRIKDWNIE